MGEGPPPEVTVWLCGKTGQAMKVSSDSDQEFDYRDCDCGAEFAKATYRLVNPAGEEGTSNE